LANCEAIRLPADTWCSPTYAPDLVHAALDILIDGEKGIWHLVNEGKMTWHEFGLQVADAAGLERGLVSAEPGGPVASAALGSIRGKIMPSFTSALNRFLRDCENDWTRATVQAAE
jgi:dTDP-4-dehydrorhamnose reductase